MIFIIILIGSLQHFRKMENSAYTCTQQKINGKSFMVPTYNLFGCQKYMLPKLDNAPVHHTFFKNKELELIYQKQGIDVKSLNFNLEKEINLEGKIQQSSQSFIKEQSMSVDQLELSVDEKIKQPIGRLRPPLRKSGFTHFIHIPFADILRESYENQIAPLIDEEDRDLLQPLETMHMTVMVFRLKDESDLKIWSKVLKSAKRAKANIRGVSIFPIKKNMSRVLYLNIKGLEDLIDRIVSKAIELQLVTEKELSFIKFDKATQTYKAEPHISLLRTKGEDLFDFTDYLASLKNINISKVPVTEIRLSMIGSFDGEDYYNEQIVKL